MLTTSTPGKWGSSPPGKDQRADAASCFKSRDVKKPLSSTKLQSFPRNVQEPPTIPSRQLHQQQRPDPEDPPLKQAIPDPRPGAPKVGSRIANFWASHACQGPRQAARLRRVSPPAADPWMCLRRANHGASQWSLQPRPEEGNSLCQDFGSLRDTKESRSGSVPLFGLLTGSRVAGEPVDGASRRKRKPKAGCQGSGCMLFCLFRK